MIIILLRTATTEFSAYLSKIFVIFVMIFGKLHCVFVGLFY